VAQGEQARRSWALNDSKPPYNGIPSVGDDRVMGELSGKVEELLRDADAIAETRGHAVVGTEHVLLAMTRQSTESFARRLLDDVGATDALRSRIESVIGPG
jgi:ATP-dependent Clp protease ATP-binding subunit ClpA